jgi:hypothetical protein
MIIKLKNNKSVSECTEIVKKRGENILISGCSISANSVSISSFLSSLLSEGNIDGKSISINTNGDNSFYANWISILQENKKSDITQRDFLLLNLMYQKELTAFEKINFNKNTVNNLLKDHTLFLCPALEKSSEKLLKMFNKRLYCFLKNLPINTGKEIPILITEISLLKKNDSRRYLRMLKDLNKKGYFLIITINSYPENPYFLQEAFKHMLIMKDYTNNNDLIEIFNKEKLKINIRNLDIFEYYYLKDFKLTSKKFKKMPYLLPKKLDKYPDYSRMHDFLLIAKINNF